MTMMKMMKMTIKERAKMACQKPTSHCRFEPISAAPCKILIATSCEVTANPSWTLLADLARIVPEEPFEQHQPRHFGASRRRPCSKEAKEAAIQVFSSL